MQLEEICVLVNDISAFSERQTRYCNAFRCFHAIRNKSACLPQDFESVEPYGCFMEEFVRWVVPNMSAERKLPSLRASLVFWGSRRKLLIGNEIRKFISIEINPKFRILSDVSGVRKFLKT